MGDWMRVVDAIDPASDERPVSDGVAVWARKELVGRRDRGGIACILDDGRDIICFSGLARGL